MREDTRASLDAYIRFYETLTPKSVGELRSLVAPDVRFRDPFNDVQGVDAYERVLAKMFEDLDEPRFEVRHSALEGAIGFLTWRFVYRDKRGRERTIVGMSELHFDAEGRVALHVDHWDAAAQVYEHLPVLGIVLRRIRRRIAA